MERRFGTRQAVAVNVVLYDKGVPLAMGRARDVSLLGMFVETTGLRLKKHRILEVGFADNESSKGQRLPAMVVRQDEDGVGLIFETSDPETRRMVREYAGYGEREVEVGGV